MCLCHLTHYAKVIKTALEMRSQNHLAACLPLALFLATISAKAQDMCYDNEGNFLCNETHDSTATGNQPGARNEAATGMESAPPGGVIDYVLKKTKKTYDLNYYANYLKTAKENQVPEKLLVNVHKQCGLEYGYTYTQISPEKEARWSKTDSMGLGTGGSGWNYDKITVGKISCLQMSTPKRKFGSARQEEQMKKTIRYLCKLAADRGVPQEIKINAWDTVKQKLNNDEYWIGYAEQLVNKSYYCKDRLGIEFVTISPEDVINHDETEVVMPSIPSFY